MIFGVIGCISHSLSALPCRPLLIIIIMWHSLPLHKVNTLWHSLPLQNQVNRVYFSDTESFKSRFCVNTAIGPGSSCPKVVNWAKLWSTYRTEEQQKVRMIVFFQSNVVSTQGCVSLHLYQRKVVLPYICINASQGCAFLPVSTLAKVVLPYLYQR